MDTLVYAPSVSLDDKYDVEEGQVFITGVQALVRLPLLRREIDAKNGLNTAGFIWAIADRRLALTTSNYGRKKSGLLSITLSSGRE